MLNKEAYIKFKNEVMLVILDWLIHIIYSLTHPIMIVIAIIINY